MIKEEPLLLLLVLSVHLNVNCNNKSSHNQAMEVKIT